VVPPVAGCFLPGLRGLRRLAAACDALPGPTAPVP